MFVAIADCVEEGVPFASLDAQEEGEPLTDAPPLFEELTEDVELIVGFIVTDADPLTDPVLDPETLAVPVKLDPPVRVDEKEPAGDRDPLADPVGDLLVLLVAVSNPPTEQPNFFCASSKAVSPRGPL